jgi:hypothetical protein
VGHELPAGGELAADLLAGGTFGEVQLQGNPEATCRRLLFPKISPALFSLLVAIQWFSCGSSSEGDSRNVLFTL